MPVGLVLQYPVVAECIASAPALAHTGGQEGRGGGGGGGGHVLINAHYSLLKFTELTLRLLVKCMYYLLHYSSKISPRVKIFAS